MHLSLVAIALWAAGSALNVTLVVVLFYKRRNRVVPWFTAWMTYELLYALACFLVYRTGSKETYRLVYWIGALIDFLLQIAVVGEIAQSVLKQSGRWDEGARRPDRVDAGRVRHRYTSRLLAHDEPLSRSGEFAHFCLPGRAIILVHCFLDSRAGFPQDASASF